MVLFYLIRFLYLRIKFGGGGGIRTLDRGFGPYTPLAGERLQPLGHPSVGD